MNPINPSFTPRTRGDACILLAVLTALFLVGLAFLFTEYTIIPLLEKVYAAFGFDLPSGK